MCEWLRANKLPLNANKTKYVIFATRHNLTNKPDLHLMGEDSGIEQVSFMKHLGVILGEYLTIDEQVSLTWSMFLVMT